MIVGGSTTIHHVTMRHPYTVRFYLIGFGLLQSYSEKHIMSPNAHQSEPFAHIEPSHNNVGTHGFVLI